MNRPASESNIDGATFAFLTELRREITSGLNSIRREMNESHREMQQRLSGIESAMGEGKSVMQKHNEQIGELSGADADLDKRVRLLEADLERRAARADAEREGISSLVKTTIVTTTIGAVTLGVVAIAFWILAQYARAAPTGVAP